MQWIRRGEEVECNGIMVIDEAMEFTGMQWNLGEGSAMEFG